MQCLLWLDLETTGLSPIEHKILEMGCALTQMDGTPISESKSWVLWQPDAILDTMNEWCAKQHGESGLTQECRESSLTLTDILDEFGSWLNVHSKGATRHLAGNSVHFDRAFLAHHIPPVLAYVHYRQVDVSSMKVVVESLRPEWKSVQPKPHPHRAIQDIQNSISEYRHYLNAFGLIGGGNAD